MSSGLVIVDKLGCLAQYGKMNVMLETYCVVNALILTPPTNKEGNLKVHDHWRGISLLDVVGKVLGRIIQDID